MTSPAAPLPPLVITPPPGTRLEQLVSEYEVLKSRAEAAQEALKACTDGIKAEVCGAYPQTRAFVIAGSRYWPSLRLSWSNPWRVDARRLKKDDPVTYVRYAVRSETGRWELRLDQGGPQ